RLRLAARCVPEARSASPYNSSRMREVAIVGAGTLGGTLALILAGRDVVSRIRLIDEVRQVATGTALDIMQAAPLNGGATFISGSQDLTMVAGSSVVVVADRADGGEWQGDGALRLLETVARIAPSSIVLGAGAEGVPALFGRHRREVACLVAPDDSSGRRERAVALPVRVGPPGLTISELPALEPRARVAFNNARLL